LVLNQSGGIHISGDADSSPQPAVLFARIMNNTIFGDTGGTVGVGIKVDENVSPTILNNIIANTTIGIQVDASSTSTVIGFNLYQKNGANLVGDTETGATALLPNEPLFMKPDTGNFYLAPGTKAIDSSVNSLPERPALTDVVAPLGIPQSPILAPELDLLGQLRVDDPSVASPPGLGSNVFKDRGAFDRSDFVGPSATLINPADNDATGKDRDARQN